MVGAAESGPTGGNRTVVVLDDSGDEEEETRGDPQRLSGREASTVDLDDGDPFDDVADKAGGAGKDEAEDEFQEYVRQAEARLRRTESASQSKEEQKVTDGAVVIYITSRIPGTANLRVKRGLKQHLGAARDAFCQYQRLKHVPGFPKENDEAIFLTWKGNRIYNSTTCVGLGICLDDEGRLRTSTKTRSGTTETGFIGGRSLADGADQLHFEAWTEETYQAYLEEKERERLRASGELPFDYGVNDDDASGKGRTQGSADEPVEAAPVRKFRVFLVAKGQDPVRVSATPQTTIAELVAQYRRKAGLAADASVSLQFDGDTLDPANTLEAADISEDDKIDVYVS